MDFKHVSWQLAAATFMQSHLLGSDFGGGVRLAMETRLMRISYQGLDLVLRWRLDRRWSCDLYGSTERSAGVRGAAPRSCRGRRKLHPGALQALQAYGRPDVMTLRLSRWCCLLPLPRQMKLHLGTLEALTTYWRPCIMALCLSRLCRFSPPPCQTKTSFGCA